MLADRDNLVWPTVSRRSGHDSDSGHDARNKLPPANTEEIEYKQDVGQIPSTRVAQTIGLVEREHDRAVAEPTKSIL